MSLLQCQLPYNPAISSRYTKARHMLLLGSLQHPDPTYWVTGRKRWNVPKSLSFPCHQRACWGCGQCPWALKDLCPGNRQSSFTSQWCIREQENVCWLQHWHPCWTVTAIYHHTHSTWQAGAWYTSNVMDRPQTAPHDMLLCFKPCKIFLSTLLQSAGPFQSLRT